MPDPNAQFLAKYRRLVPPDKWEAFLEYFKKPLRKSLRVNTLKISINDFKNLATQEAWELTPVPWCAEGFFIDRADKSVPLGSTWQHLAGLFYIQEASSMLPAEKIQSASPTYILDLCSAPGSKLTQLASKFPQSLIVANEVDRKRVIALQQNITRQGLTNIVVTSLDPSVFAQKLPNFFDLVITDAPCSGEGMIRKDRKVLEFWSEKKVSYMAGIQKRIAKDAFTTLKAAGEMIYSTCTYAPEENEEILQMLQTESGAEIQEMQRIWPYEFDTEGFFVSRILKNQSSENSGEAKNSQLMCKQVFAKKHRSKMEESGVPFKKTLAIKNIILKNWGIDLTLQLEHCTLLEENGRMTLLPQAASSLPLRTVSTGLELGKLIRNEFILSHEAAIAFGQNASKNTLELPETSIRTFLTGHNLDLANDFEAGRQVILKHHGFPLGLAKVVDNKLKNQLPREFRIK